MRRLLFFVAILSILVGSVLGGCPAGQYLSGGSCVNCLVNTWKSDTGNGPCNSCPADSTSSGATAGQAYANSTCNCNNGYYGLSSTSDTTCTICPMNTYKSGTLNGPSTLCIACPAGSSTTSQYPGMSKYDCLAKPGFVTDDGSNTFICTSGYYPNNNDCPPCPSNSYKNFHGNSSCVTCPSNTVASGTTGAVFANGGCNCITGYYGLPDSSSTTCTICPVNTAKNGNWNTASCPACQYGTYTNGLTGQSSCTVMPGFAWDSSASAYSCTYGYYNTPQTCVQCPAGTFKNTIGNVSCTACPAGSTSASTVGSSYAQNACTCNAGYYGLDTTSSTTCTICASGTYKDVGNAASCTSCPTNSTASGATGQQYANQACTCNAGTYGLDTTASTTCTMCPSGTYKGSGNAASCTSCPSNSVSSGWVGQVYAKDSCTCNAGYSGLSSTGSTTCTICASGTYKAAGNAASCTSCPTNSTASGVTGQQYANQACTCNAGTYGLDTTASTTCTMCPSGTYKGSGNAASCTSCPSNSVSSGWVGQVYAKDSCTCNAGYSGLSSTGSTTCTICAAGTYKDVGNAASCTSCPTNSTSTGVSGQQYANQACTCNSATYGLDTTASTTCTMCPSGTYKGSGNAASCTSCPSNSGSSGWVGQVYAKDACTCNAGYSGLDSTGSTTCTICGSGTYKSAGNAASCTSCPTNSSTSGATGQQYASQACICNAGSYGLDTTASIICSLCPSDTYKSTQSNGNSNICIACAGGSTTGNVVGATSSSMCHAANGYVSDGSGGFICDIGFGYSAGSCSACNAGTYKAVTGNVSCSACPTNSASNGYTGQVYAKDACTCNAGYSGLSSAGSSSCTICAAGTYKDAGNAASCTSCPTNSTSTGLTGRQYASQACTCNAGTYGLDTTASTTCSMCPSGTYKGSGNAASCTSCPSNSISSGWVGQVYAKDACTCNAGYSGLDTAGSTTCTICAAGTYKDVGNAASCTSCPTNSTSSGVSGQQYPYQACTCNSGTYGLDTTASSSCTVCPAGTYKASGNAASCASCPSNSASTGWVGQVYAKDACTCNAGYSGLDTPGSTTCSLCAAGTYKDVGNAASCTSCPTNSTSTGLTARQYANQACTCNSGTYGLDTSVSTTCTMCPSGSYKGSGNAPSCSSCPADAISRNTTGQAFANDACTCNVGHYGLESSNSTSCISCPINTYNAAANNGNISQVCTNCTLPFSTGFLSGSVSCACPAGMGFANNNCYDCPADMYSPFGNVSCFACPWGYSTFSQTKCTSLTDCKLKTSFALNSDGIAVCAAGNQLVNSDCVPCAVNTYKDSVGNQSCVACSYGSSTNDLIGATQCESTTNSSSSSTSSTGGGSSLIGLIVGTLVGALCLIAFAMLSIFLVARKKRAQKEKEKVDIIRRLKIEEQERIRASIAPMANRTAFTHQLTGPFFRNTGDNSVASTVSIMPVTNNTKLSGLTQTMSFAPTTTVIAFPGFLEIDGNMVRKTRTIGQGGYSSIYQVEILDEKIRKAWTIDENGEEEKFLAGKVITKRASESGVGAGNSAVTDFENEVSVMYALQCSPNIARIIAVSKSPELMLIMKMYPESLTAFIHAQNSQFCDNVVEAAGGSYYKAAAVFSHDLWSAVRDMHRMFIAHLDLKPQNILLELLPDNVALSKHKPSRFPYRAVLTDFGITRITNDNAVVKGRRIANANGLSVNYCSPESFHSVRMMEKGLVVPAFTLFAMDIYSLTSTIYELLTKEMPFKSLSIHEIEGALLAGSRPTFEKFPKLTNVSDIAIFNSLMPLFEKGWTGNPQSRSTINEIKPIILNALEAANFDCTAEN